MSGTKMLPTIRMWSSFVVGNWLYLASAQVHGAPGIQAPIVAAKPPTEVRMTLQGPIYTVHGMTLYSAPSLDSPGKSECTNVELTTGNHPAQRWTYPLPYAPGERRSCIQKWPPLEAAAKSKPTGDWTIVDREVGVRQWAFHGNPVYFSIRDEVPGQVNGSGGNYLTYFKPLAAPFDAPSGIQLATAEEGLVLADSHGDPLHTVSDDRGQEQNASLAPAGAVKHGNWSIVVRADGTRQWAYQGHALYSGIGDTATLVKTALNDQSTRETPIVVYPKPSLPSNMTVRKGPSGPMVTDDRGMTLYYFVCAEENDEHLQCDERGDTAVYYQANCGGPSRCADVFKVVPAPKGARENEVWTVHEVDPADPLRFLRSGETGVRAWFYYDHPVFRYSEDLQPGDFYGMGVGTFVVATLRVVPSSFYSNFNAGGGIK
jgi:predicted lipoprotein with Yx(FWY)xxD motif